MLNKTIKGSFYNLKSHYCPDGFSFEEREEKITDRQRRRLVEYINSLHNEDDEEKEQKIAELEELTESEAAEMLSEIPW